MNIPIDTFCDDLCTNLVMIGDDLRGLKAKALGKAPEVERAVRHQMDGLQKKIGEANAAVEAARPTVDARIRTQRSAAESKIAEWNAKRDARNLRLPAKMADAYANATSVIGSLAVDKAAKTALEAWLAQYDLETSKVAQSAARAEFPQRPSGEVVDRSGPGCTIGATPRRHDHG